MPAEYGEPLSPRELEIVELVAKGLTNREIAAQAFLSHNTVKVHLRNIFAKTNVASRTELTVLAIQEGWIEAPGIQVETEGETSEEAPAGAKSQEDLELSQLAPWPHHRWIALMVGLGLAVIVLLLPQRSSQQAAASDPGVVFGPVQSSIGASALETEDGWEELSPLPVRRAGLGVTAVNGRIYTVGGMTEDGPTGQLDIYQIENGSWESGTPRPLALANVGTVVVEDKLLVPGGCDVEWNPSPVTSLYDLKQDTWLEGSPLPTPLCAYALTVYQGKAYLFGGLGENGYQAVAYAYDIASDMWQALTAPHSARGFGAAAVLTNRIFYVGGYNGKQEQNVCEVYLPEANRWEECMPMLQPRGGLGLASIGGRLQAIGGGWDTYLGFNERYDPNTNQWAAMETPIIGEWRNLGLTTWHNALYIVGGWNGDYMNRTYTLEVLQFRIFIPTTSSGSP